MAFKIGEILVYKLNIEEDYSREYTNSYITMGKIAGASYRKRGSTEHGSGAPIKKIRGRDSPILPQQIIVDKYDGAWVTPGDYDFYAYTLENDKLDPSKHGVRQGDIIGFPTYEQFLLLRSVGKILETQYYDILRRKESEVKALARPAGESAAQMQAKEDELMHAKEDELMLLRALEAKGEELRAVRQELSEAKANVLSPSEPASSLEPPAAADVGGGSNKRINKRYKKSKRR